MIAGVTNSVASTREPGRSKSCSTSLTKVECQSPVITTGFATCAVRSYRSRRWRASG